MFHYSYSGVVKMVSFCLFRNRGNNVELMFFGESFEQVDSFGIREGLGIFGHVIFGVGGIDDLAEHAYFGSVF